MTRLVAKRRTCAIVKIHMGVGTHNTQPPNLFCSNNEPPPIIIIMPHATPPTPTTARSHHDLLLFLQNIYHHVWHWSQLGTPQLWLQLGAFRGVVLDTATTVRRHAWRALWGLVVPPLMLQGVDYCCGLNIIGNHHHNNHHRPTLLGSRLASSPPMQVLSSLSDRPLSSTATAVLASGATTAYLAANAYFLYKALVPFYQTWPFIKEAMGTNRSTTTLDPAFFAALCRCGRAAARLRYDVYLPPPDDNNNNNDDNDQQATTKQSAILFLPGGGVGHRAYAVAAHALSERGHVVVVVNAEPLRQVFPALGYTAHYLQHYVIKSVTRQYPKQLGGGANDVSWALVGHSLGAFAALQVAQELRIARIVMWAAAPFVTVMPDLSAACTDDNLHICVIQGSRDVIIQWVLQHLQPPTADWTRAFWAKLPPTAVERVIADGTHAGFGRYTSRRFPEAAAPVQQESLAVEWTHQFLSSRGKG